MDATASSPRGYVSWETLCRILILLYGRMVSMLSWSSRNWKCRTWRFSACVRRAGGCVLHDVRPEYGAVDTTASSPRDYGGDGRVVDVACSCLEFVRLQRLSCNRRICFGDEVSSVGEVEATPFQHACLSWSLRNWFVLPRIYRCTEADDSGEARRGLGVGGGAR